MRKNWPLLGGLAGLLVLATALIGCGTSGVQGPVASSPLQVKLSSQQEGIWVNGEGKVTVKPDVANISLGVETRGNTVSEAQAQAASAMDKVMNALTKNGVAKKDIQTQYFNISPITRWDERNQREVVLGYRVSNTVNAKIRDIDKAGATIDAVAGAGGDLIRVNNIYFSIDDPTVYHKEARDKAIADAANKAGQLASLTGVKLGKATYISENLYFPPTPIYRGAMLEAAPGQAPTTPVSPGETEVKLTVQVVYAILN